MNSQCSTHPYCPHLHFQNCQTHRKTKIKYTNTPSSQINPTSNAHIKTLLNQSVKNVSTLAYERYHNHPSLIAEEDCNFSKNYYLQNCPDNHQLANTLVKDVQAELSEGNAYVLAVEATKQYNVFAKQRQEYLKSARHRANNCYQTYFQNKHNQKIKQQELQLRWVTDYYRKVQQLIDHIYGNSQNNDPNLQDRLFIKEMQAKTAKTLSNIKVTDPATAMNILTALRALLLKQKLNLEQQRQDQQHANQSVSASAIDTSNADHSQNVSSASFISGATNQTNLEEGESKIAQKYCDFDTLQKKWGVRQVDEIRNILRRLICKNMVIKAEGAHMKEKQKANTNNQLLKKQLAAMGQTVNVNNKKTNNATALLSSRKTASTETREIMFRELLDKEEQTVKTSLLKGGALDSLGDIYQRNRNYSLLFKKRQIDSSFTLQERPTNKQHSTKSQSLRR